MLRVSLNPCRQMLHSLDSFGVVVGWEEEAVVVVGGDLVGGELVVGG